MSQIAVHTKPCCSTLGIEQGLEAIASSSVTAVVLWAGDAGVDLQHVRSCRRLGLSVIALALPKFSGFAQFPSEDILQTLECAAAVGVPQACLIFSDSSCARPSAEVALRLRESLRSLPVPVLLQNNGQPTEYFADPAALLPLIDGRRVRLALDLGHLGCSGSGLPETPSLWPSVSMLTLHDNDGRHDLHLPVGEGVGRGASLARLPASRQLPPWIVLETGLGDESRCRTWTQALESQLATVLTAVQVIGRKEGVTAV